jgi:hypothetical protein
MARVKLRVLSADDPSNAGLTRFAIRNRIIEP